MANGTALSNTRRSRATQINANVLAQLQSGVVKNIRLALFADAVFEVAFHRGELLSFGGRAWFGRIDGLEHSSVTLVLTEGVVSAAVHAAGGGEYEIRLGGDGLYLVRELDRNQPTSQCGNQAIVQQEPVALAGAAAAAEKSQPVPQSFSSGYGCDDGTVIDLLVVYTEDARIGAGGTSAIHSLIDLYISDTNDAFDRSLVDTSLRLVHREEIGYSETGQGAIDGPRLVGTVDGFLDGVHPLRDQYGADCVCLWVQNLDSGGIGYFPHPSLTGIGASGFTEMRQDSGGMTLAHEIGHNMFCAHDRANAPDPPYAHYSYGYREPGSAWHDIMAYPPGDLIPYFANPNVYWPGPVPPNPGPTGVPAGNPSTSCDIALTMNELRLYVANFRPTMVPGLPSVLFVRSTAAPGGDGLSWGTAFNDLQDALCIAAGSNGDVEQLWVTSGTYKPDRGNGDRSASFHLIDGLAIYGGFNGSETLLSQRNVAVNVTTLSGDIGAVGNYTDNSFHVVTGTGNASMAVLDGFTITRGNANGGTHADDGGGGLIVYDGGSPTIANCTFTLNTAAKYGGAVYNYLLASPTITGCTFTSNSVSGTAWPEGGGAIHSYDQCSPVVTNCTFTSNTANLGGAVANLFDSNPTLTTCVFSLNISTSGSNKEGGGVYNYTTSSPTLTGCTFSMNSAERGGGLYNAFDCSPSVSACTFDKNTATVDGGGMYCYSNCNPTVTGCTFSENTAASGGGLIVLFDCIPKLTNCTLRKNSTTGDGGGVLNYSNCHTELTNCLLAGNSANFGGGMIDLFNSNAKLINCTVSGNVANGAGGGLYNYEGSNAVLTNTLMWSNRVGATMNEPQQITGFNSTPVINYCSIQGWTGGLGGSNNNGSNPNFVDADGTDNIFGTADDNHRLQSVSPAINTGDNAAVPPGVMSDIDGGPRILSGTVDRGAYEFVPIIPFDYDSDGDVDLLDLSTFNACRSRAAVPHNGTPACIASDRDIDNDVDQNDFGFFQRCYTATDKPGSTTCAN